MITLENVKDLTEEEMTEVLSLISVRGARALIRKKLQELRTPTSVGASADESEPPAKKKTSTDDVQVNVYPVSNRP